jgi:hypothetical protein
VSYPLADIYGRFWKIPKIVGADKGNIQAQNQFVAGLFGLAM